MININIDSDDVGKIKLAVQGHVIPDWVYENSQVEYENKRIRQIRQHQLRMEQEAKYELQKKRQRNRRQQQSSIDKIDEKKVIHKPSLPKKKVTSDDLEF